MTSQWDYLSEPIQVNFIWFESVRVYLILSESIGVYPIPSLSVSLRVDLSLFKLKCTVEILFTIRVAITMISASLSEFFASFTTSGLIGSKLQ